MFYGVCLSIFVQIKLGLQIYLFLDAGFSNRIPEKRVKDKDINLI